MTKIISSWILYLRLRRKDGVRIAAGEIYLAIAISLSFSLFWFCIGMRNSFGKDGLIDGLGSITSTLAGFYVAGLVAIATFFRENSSLDDVIKDGPVILNLGKDHEDWLTRRQYVCSMFGLLVGVSFCLAISAVLARSISSGVQEMLPSGGFSVKNFSMNYKDVVELSGVSFWMSLFVWQVLVTLHGLYYLMDRIYDVRPRLGKPAPDASRVENKNDE